MKKVKKLIIPAAGWGTRFLPLTKVVHKELVPVLDKPLIHYLVKEAKDAGIEEIILVISPRKMDILNYFSSNEDLNKELINKNKIDLLNKVIEMENITINFVIQNEQLGLAHALSCARHLINNEPVAVILGDDLIWTEDKKNNAISQLINKYNESGNTIFGTKKIDGESAKKYGVVFTENSKVEGAFEKPTWFTKSDICEVIIGRYVFSWEYYSRMCNMEFNKNTEMNPLDIFQYFEEETVIIDGIRFDLGSLEGFVQANNFYYDIYFKK